MLKTKLTKKNLFKNMLIRNFASKISLIVCTDDRNGIAKNGQIPWSIKEDMHFFYDVTTTKNNSTDPSNVIIMGKNTWMSLPDKSRGFKNRINIVVSSKLSQTDLDVTNVTNSQARVVKSFNAGINMARNMGVRNIFISGGTQIYEEGLDKCIINNLYLTKIRADYQCDKFFPMFMLSYLFNHSHNLIYEKDFRLTDNISNKSQLVSFKKYSTDEYIWNDNNNAEETAYLDLLKNTIKNGSERVTRNSTTLSTFGNKLEFDLSEGFPLLTTKKISLYNIFHELMFFVRGQTNTNILKDMGINIWNDNTSRKFLDSVGLSNRSEGDMGEMYGFQWRHFGANYEGYNKKYHNQGFDQLAYCLELIKTDPQSRRIVMTTYNPSQAKEGCLFPCHGVFLQFYCDGNKLSCMMTQRSADIFLGLPYNIASYALLTHMICEIVNNDTTYLGPKLSPGRLIISMGDIHLYHSHYSQAIRQILRQPRNFPELSFNRQVTRIEDFEFKDLELKEYNCYPNINAKMIA